MPPMPCQVCVPPCATCVQPCQAAMPCCQQAKLVRKVYPVAGLVDAKHDDSPEDLIRIICRTVAPDSWDLVGQCGVIDYFPMGKCLVVSQTAAVHGEIDQLLGELRSAMGMPSQTQTASIQQAQFATFAEDPCPGATNYGKSNCCHEDACTEGCSKDCCITVEVAAGDGCVELCRDADGNTCLCCKGVKLCVPSGCCKLKIVTGKSCCTNCTEESCTPCFEGFGCGPVVPYVPTEIEVGFNEFEMLLREVEKDRSGGYGLNSSGVLEPVTPEDLPVFGEPVSGRYIEQSVCPESGHCTRFTGVNRLPKAPPK
jgi:hypothetical protein